MLGTIFLVFEIFNLVWSFVLRDLTWSDVEFGQDYIKDIEESQVSMGKFKSSQQVGEEHHTEDEGVAVSREKSASHLTNENAEAENNA